MHTITEFIICDERAPLPIRTFRTVIVMSLWVLMSYIVRFKASDRTTPLTATLHNVILITQITNDFGGELGKVETPRGYVSPNGLRKVDFLVLLVIRIRTAKYLLFSTSRGIVFKMVSLVSSHLFDFFFFLNKYW